MKINGEISNYPNHGKMQRNRIIKLKAVNGKCEICGKDADRVHHIDGTKDNHNLDNLVALCSKCHGILHANRKNSTSKYIRLYGMTLNEMAARYGGHPTRFFQLHKKNLLHDFLDYLEIKYKEATK